MAHRVAVYLILEAHGRVLFGLRHDTGYRDGEYGLPSGKVDDGETLLDAMTREAREELGIDVGNGLELVHASERNTPTGVWLDLYFRCLQWHGEPKNAEPHKCRDLAWLEPTDHRVIEYISDVLRLTAAGSAFSTYVGT